MEKQKKKQKGITLIALVISIIVMLILAGVSLNMTVGDNGIIKQAQAATYMESVAYLQEQMNYDYVNKYANDELATLEAYIRDGWITRILSSGNEGTINVKYIFVKSNLDEEWKRNLVGGDGEAYTLLDVYGINSNLDVWYVDSNGESYGKAPEDLNLNEEEHIEFADSDFRSVIANMTGKSADQVKVGDIQDITNLKLSNTDLDNLDDLYYFPNLKILVLENIHLKNVDGIVYSQQLETITVNTGAIIDNWNGFGGLGNVNYFDIYNAATDENLPKIANSVGKIQSLRTLYIRHCENLTNVKVLANMQNKSVITKLWLDDDINVTNYEGLEGFTNLEWFDHANARNVSDITALSSMAHMWRFYASNLSADITNKAEITMLKNLPSLTSIYLVGGSFTSLTPIAEQVNFTNLAVVEVQSNSNIILNSSSTGIENLRTLYNSGKLKINDSYKKYLMSSTTTNVQLGSNGLTDLSVLSSYTNIITLNLSNNTGLTNESMKWFQTNNRQTITTLYLESNSITNMEWLIDSSGNCALPNLTTLGLYNCDSLTSLKGLEKCTKLVTLDLSYCDNIKDSGFHNGTTYYLPNSIKNLYLYSASKYDKCDGLANLSNLQHIEIAHTAVSGTNATTLNSLTKIDFIGLGNNSSTNNISSSSLIATINRCTSWVDFTGSYAGSLVKNLNNSTLTRLKCDYGSTSTGLNRSRTNSYYYIDELDLSSATNLWYLYINDRYVKSVKLPNTTTLTHLYLKQMYLNYKFTVPSLANYSNLSVLELNNNYLNKDDFNNLCTDLNLKSKLTSINLEGNSISKITNIAKIGTVNNEITDFKLNLKGNIIDSLNGIETMNNNITEIDLSNNRITDITPLKDLATNNPNKKLRTITLTGNSISESDINLLKNYYTVIY